MVLGRWNLIQALWGTGRAFYSLNAPVIELNQENSLCRFKAIGYCKIPATDNNEGLVVLCFNKKEQQIKDQKQQLVSSLTGMLGNSPNLLVSLDSIREVKEGKSQVMIYVTEKSATGTTRKIPANELVNHYSQNMQKNQLVQMGVENLFAQVKPDLTLLKDYLDNPPCNINPILWKQAQLENPNPNMYIPVPMIGFKQVKYRHACQEEEVARHRGYLDNAAEAIQELQRQHTKNQAKLKEYRRTLLECQHRVLQVFGKKFEISMNSIKLKCKCVKRNIFFRHIFENNRGNVNNSTEISVDTFFLIVQIISFLVLF